MISAPRQSNNNAPSRRQRTYRARATELSSLKYMCNNFTDVLKVTETHLHASRQRPAIHHHCAVALVFAPRLQKKQTNRGELKSLRPMKWCLVSAFGSFPSPRRHKNFAAAQVIEQCSLAIVNDFIMILPMDMIPLQSLPGSG